MTERTAPRLAKWPFLLGDLLFLGVAVVIVYFGARPIGMWQALACLASVGAGAWICILPWLKEYEAALRLAEAGNLASTVDQIRNLEKLGGQVSSITAQLQAVQEQSGKSISTAGEIASRMTAEAKAFGEFMQKANDSEKAHLRLEAEKLRRAQGDWLEVVVRMLDHTYALNQAAARSGQKNVIDQMANFQNALRDAARRVGLVPLIAAAGEVFDEKKHHLMDEKAVAPAGAKVADTVATGFSFQGQIIRPVLVTLQATQPQEEQPQSEPAPEAAAMTEPGAKLEQTVKPEPAVKPEAPAAENPSSEKAPATPGAAPKSVKKLEPKSASPQSEERSLF